MISKKQQPEPQKGDSALGATACSCEGGGTSPPERERGELRGESQAHAVRGTGSAVGQLSELVESLELSQKGSIPSDLTCLIHLFLKVFLYLPLSMGES